MSADTYLPMEININPSLVSRMITYPCNLGYDQHDTPRRAEPHYSHDW